MTANRALIEAARAGLAAIADPQRAPGMQAYMKSSMPYHGVAAPQVAQVERRVFADHPLTSSEDWRDTVLALFREATHREEWYVAVDLARRPSYRAFAREQRSLALYETLIVESAWWDVVDAVSGDLLGGLHAAHPAWMAARMRSWSTDAHLWKRRASIISQLKRRDDVDLALLYDCIEPNLADREFFIRKAIGWALAIAARYEPEQVRRYVQINDARLSPLSKRRALKNLSG